MATERSLPEGWTRSIDPSTELPYYHNAALGESRWEPPGAPEGAAMRIAAVAAKKVAREYGIEAEWQAHLIDADVIASTSGRTRAWDGGGRGGGAHNHAAAAFLQARAANYVGGGIKRAAERTHQLAEERDAAAAAAARGADASKRPRAAAGGGVAGKTTQSDGRANG